MRTEYKRPIEAKNSPASIAKRYSVTIFRFSSFKLQKLQNLIWYLVVLDSPAFLSPVQLLYKKREGVSKVFEETTYLYWMKPK